MNAPDRDDAPDARELAEDQADWEAAYDQRIAANVRGAQLRADVVMHPTRRDLDRMEGP